jgi:dTDP-4-dehydrorhamnose reductase
VIVVFGAGGQLGQELVACAGARSIALQALARDQVDISDEAAVLDALARLRPQVVVNAAAYTKVDKAESEPEAAWRANVAGPDLLARATHSVGAALIHISTDYVFDGSKSGAYVETDPITPLGVYGRTKAEGEQAVRAQQPRHIILRTSWVYGAYGHNILKTVLRLAAEREELRFVADQRGCPTATRDLAEAILGIAPRLAADEPLYGTYHFAGTGVTTWHGFVERVVAAQAPLTGRRPVVVPITTADYPTPAWRPVNSELDSGLFAATFGIRAQRWEERVDETVATLLKHRKDSAA